MTPPPLKTNKQTKHKQKIGEKKTNIDLAKMVSDCTIYIHKFSQKKKNTYIAGKGPGLPSAGGSTILSIRRETPKPWTYGLHINSLYGPKTQI